MQLSANLCALKQNMSFMLAFIIEFLVTIDSGQFLLKSKWMNHFKQQFAKV
jgi:hypothetical protein